MVSFKDTLWLGGSEEQFHGCVAMGQCLAFTFCQCPEVVGHVGETDLC